MFAEGRPDLLTYFDGYIAASRRYVHRVEQWRRRRWSHAEIAIAARRVGAALARQQVGEGGRVGLYLQDGPLWLAAYFGVLLRGAAVVPIDVAFDADAVSRLAPRLELDAWITEPEVKQTSISLPQLELDWDYPFRDPSRALVFPSSPEADPDRLAEVVMTSGTHHQPQLVGIKHRNLRAVLDALEGEVCRYRWALRIAPRLSIAVALPLSHLYGQVMGIFVPLLLGSDVSFFKPMPAGDLIAALRAQQAWVLATVPHTLSLLADSLMRRGRQLWGDAGMEQRLERAAGLRWYRRWLLFAPLRRLLGARLVAVISGGAALDPPVERFWRRLGYQVIQGYGLTEAAPLVTLNHPLHAETGSVGRPLPGVELQLSDSGEILVRGPSVATPAADGARVDAAGWLHTGDLGRRTEEGRIEFVGRRRERIVTPAGLNVDLETVATELRRQPAIIDAVTLERPWGPAGSVSAVLLVRPGADVPSAIRAANVSLPDAARVRDWYVWPETDLPRTPTGKPRRAPLVVWLQQTRNHRTLHHKVAGDPVPALQTVTRLVSEISATSHRELTPGTPLGEALTSLERVELAARLEQDFGIFLSDEAFAGRQTLAGLAKGIARPQQAEQGGAPLLEIPATRGASTPIEAPWRLWAPVRGIRFLLQELAMQPLWRSCVRLRVSGLEHVRSLPPPFLIAANHVSLLDPGAVLFAFPWRLRRRIAPAALWERFSVHRRGRLQYLLGVLALNIFPLVQLGDWRSSLQIAGFLADRGYCPLIYPEGGRSSDGMPRGFRQGIGLISQDLHLPILPCAVAGLHTVLPVGSRWPRRSGLRRLPVAVQFGEPLAAASPGNDREALVKTLTRRINELHRAARALAGSL